MVIGVAFINIYYLSLPPHLLIILFFFFFPLLAAAVVVVSVRLTQQYYLIRTHKKYVSDIATSFRRCR